MMSISLYVDHWKQTQRELWDKYRRLSSGLIVLLFVILALLFWVVNSGPWPSNIESGGGSWEPIFALLLVVSGLILSSHFVDEFNSYKSFQDHKDVDSVEELELRSWKLINHSVRKQSWLALESQEDKERVFGIIEKELPFWHLLLTWGWPHIVEKTW